jgi:hypothetical protein
MESLREIFFKTDRIHSFDVRCWTFDVRRSSVFSSIKLTAFQASGGARMKLYGVSFSIRPAVFLAGSWADT